MRLPLQAPRVTQHYGLTAFAQANKQWYRDGIHYGIDFGCPIGTVCYATIGGEVKTFENKASGKFLTITSGNRTVRYVHLDSYIIRSGEVKAGQPVAYTGNSGEMTTGAHLHYDALEFGKFINPELEFNQTWDGIDFKNKDWQQSRAYHRYGRKQNWLAEFNVRFKNPWLHRQLIKHTGLPLPKTEVCNALVYGGWDFDTVMNPTMYQYWSHLKKDEYQKYINKLK